MKHEKPKFENNLFNLIPIFGWIYIFYGVIFPFENFYLLAVWYIDIFLSVGVHAMQLFIACPLGKRAGYTTQKTVFYTMVFGATWWKPLQNLTALQK